MNLAAILPILVLVLDKGVFDRSFASREYWLDVRDSGLLSSVCLLDSPVCGVTLFFLRSGDRPSQCSFDDGIERCRLERVSAMDGYSNALFLTDAERLGD